MTKYLKKSFITTAMLFLFATPLFSVQIADITIEENYSSNLVLNGVGIRDKWFIDLYVGALYLENKNTNYANIINADKKMSIKLHIVSSLITSEKLQSATNEGFENSTGGNMDNIKAQIDQFLSVFKDEVKENDVYDFLYIPNDGVQVYKNNILLTTIISLEFKKALFGIWIGDDPAQSSLKNELLGL